MTNAESRQQYEGAILTQLVKNAERLAVVEQEVKSVKSDLNSLKSDLNNVREKINIIETQRLVAIEQRLTAIESDLAQLKKDVGFAKWLLVTIASGIFINLLSQPVLSLLN